VEQLKEYTKSAYIDELWVELEASRIRHDVISSNEE
jgi:hypothetical protein